MVELNVPYPQHRGTRGQYGAPGTHCVSDVSPRSKEGGLGPSDRGEGGVPILQTRNLRLGLPAPLMGRSFFLPLTAPSPGVSLVLCGQPGLCPQEQGPPEVILEREGQVLLHFAAAYGFRKYPEPGAEVKRGALPVPLRGGHVPALQVATGQGARGPQGQLAPSMTIALPPPPPQGASTEGDTAQGP